MVLLSTLHVWGLQKFWQVRLNSVLCIPSTSRPAPLTPFTTRRTKRCSDLPKEIPKDSVSAENSTSHPDESKGMKLARMRFWVFFCFLVFFFLCLISSPSVKFPRLWENHWIHKYFSFSSHCTTWLQYFSDFASNKVTVICFWIVQGQVDSWFYFFSRGTCNEDKCLLCCKCSLVS